MPPQHTHRHTHAAPCPMPNFKLIKTLSSSVSVLSSSVFEHPGTAGLIWYSGAARGEARVLGLGELTVSSAGSTVPQALAQTSRLFPGFQIK